MQMNIKRKLISNTRIRQNRLFKIKTYKRQKRTLHNDQGINPRRGYNKCKYLYTQHMSTSVLKAKAC